MDISKDPFALQRVREAAEKAKIELTLSQQVDINIPFLAANETGPKHLASSISRSKFETLIDSVLSKAKANCENFLKTNNINKNEIDDIILVGGISRIPKVQDIIKQVFLKEPNKTLNPEEAPAMGAAILASTIKDTIEELKNMDNLPLSIGIETLSGNFTKLIPQGTSLPFKTRKVFTTVYDNQPRIDLKFFLGEREIASENKSIGDLSMNIPLAKKGVPRITVQFSINQNGDLNISAQEELSRKISSYTTKINSGLSQDIVNDILEISSKFKAEDQMKKELNELKVEADNFIYTLEKLVQEKTENLKLKDYKFDNLNEDIRNLNELLKTEEFENIVKNYEVLQNEYKNINTILSSKGQ